MPGKKTDYNEALSAAQAKRSKSWAELMQDTDKDLAYKMALVELEMDTLKDPEDALMHYIGRTEGKAKEILTRKLQEWERMNFDRAVSYAAKVTGADPEQIANLETRTPEQQEALLQASAKIQLARHMMLLNSDFMIALQTLISTKGRFENLEHIDQVKRLFVLYYFTTRPFSPSETGNFTKAEKEQIVEQYKRFEDFMYDYLDGNKQTEDESFLHILKLFIEKENPTEAKEIIESLTSVLPENLIVANNKLANQMTRKGLVDFGEFSLIVSPQKKNRKPIETTVMLTYEGENVKLTGRQDITEFDRLVYNAIVTLYVSGSASHIMSPAMIYRAMTGQTNTENPSDQQIDAIINSIDKMRFIRARINCTLELQSRNISLNSAQIDDGRIDTSLLMAKWIKVKAGGQIIDALFVMDVPIIYEYSAALKQVLTLPASMLDVKELSVMYDENGHKKTVVTTRSLPNTETRLLIKSYLLQRIELMKGKNNMNNPVIALYDYEKGGEIHHGLYTKVGKQNASRAEMLRIREDAEKMLSYWKIVKHIKGFEIVKEKRKITGYKIEI